MPIKVNSSNFEAEVLKSDKPVLVDFYADWCGPCRMVAPLMEEIAAENPHIKVCKVDIDAEQDLAMEYRVMSIPTLMTFKDGKSTATTVGVRSKEDYLSMFDK